MIKGERERERERERSLLINRFLDKGSPLIGRMTQRETVWLRSLLAARKNLLQQIRLPSIAAISRRASNRPPKKEDSETLACVPPAPSSSPLAVSLSLSLSLSLSSSFYRTPPSASMHRAARSI